MKDPVNFDTIKIASVKYEDCCHPIVILSEIKKNKLLELWPLFKQDYHLYGQKYGQGTVFHKVSVFIFFFSLNKRNRKSLYQREVRVMSQLCLLGAKFSSADKLC